MVEYFVGDATDRMLFIHQKELNRIIVRTGYEELQAMQYEELINLVSGKKLNLSILASVAYERKLLKLAIKFTESMRLQLLDDNASPEYLDKITDQLTFLRRQIN